MTPCTWDQISNFSKIPRLRTLKMHLCGPDDHPDRQPIENWPDDVISFPVTTFHLGCEEDYLLGETLSRLVFPNIEDVALICNPLGDASMLLEMLCQWQPFVTADRLHLEGFSCADESLTHEMLSNSFGFPNITRLFLRNCFEIFSALAKGRHPCFPRLERLVTYYTTAAKIRSLVEFREEFQISPLSYVRVRRAKSTPKRELQWLEENIKDVKLRHIRDEKHGEDYDDSVSGEEEQGYGLKIEGAHPIYSKENDSFEDHESEWCHLGGGYDTDQGDEEEEVVE